jgi:hypothetical protein
MLLLMQQSIQTAEKVVFWKNVVTCNIFVYFTLLISHVFTFINFGQFYRFESGRRATRVRKIFISQTVNILITTALLTSLKKMLTNLHFPLFIVIVLHK